MGFFKEKKTTEICVLCGADTGVPTELSVSLRKNYIEGCGQLCERCHSACGGRKEPLSNDKLQALLAVTQSR